MGFSLSYNGLTLTPANGYTISGIEGLDGLEIRTSRSDLMGRDGGNIFAQYYGSRTISITGAIVGSNPDQYFQLLDALLAAFKRDAADKTLTVNRWDTALTTRTIEAFVLRMPEVPQKSGFITTNNFRIELICPEIFFSSNVTTSLVLQSADIVGYDIGSGGNFEFGGAGSITGFDMPITSNNTGIADNQGTASSSPMIRIDAGGGITNPTITNSTTGQVVKIARTLAANDYVTIEYSNYGATVTLNGTTNILSSYVPTGGIFYLATGANSIVFNADSFDSAATATLTWGNKYLSF